MKANKETRGHNPSQAVLELMDWTIFLAASLANLLRVTHSLAGGHQETDAIEKALARYCC